MNKKTPESGDTGDHTTHGSLGKQRGRSWRKLAAYAATGTAVCLAAWQFAAATPPPEQAPLTGTSTAGDASPSLSATASPPDTAAAAESSRGQQTDPVPDAAPGSRTGAGKKTQQTRPPVDGRMPEAATPETWPAARQARAVRAGEKKAMTDFVQSSVRISPGKKKTGPPPAVPDFSDMAAGAAKGELEAQFIEFAQSGWTQTGEILVVGEPRVQTLQDGKTKTQRVFACIDSSAVELSEPDGYVVTAATKPGTKTAVNVFDLQEIDGQWLVVNHLFPNNPEC